MDQNFHGGSNQEPTTAELRQRAVSRRRAETGAHKLKFRDANGRECEVLLHYARIETVRGQRIIRGQQKIRGVFVNRSIPETDVIA
jgi:hypothetical protein